ncbi:MAG: aminomethyl-transferring glycine dehydrogenase [Candidatus Nanopelagicales bacterium]|nr:aminomethyl-transferring glycine dehydrogenase [Candidatus Nanopelagicales bacterium]
MTFVERHLGRSDSDREYMLLAVGQPSLGALMKAALPESVQSAPTADLPAAIDEQVVLAELAGLARRNQVRRSMIGLGYHPTVTPAVIRRNLLENPAWYTAYTPYQSEISQGRLELLFVFQTVITDLTALPVANASLLDAATAAAEAMTLAYRVHRGDSETFLVDRDLDPAVLAVLATRAEPLGIRVEIVDGPTAVIDQVERSGCFGVLFGYPSSLGRVRNWRESVPAIHEAGALAIAICDPLALTVFTPPGEWDIDIAVGSAQRFGVPMAAGGPHPGFMAVRRGLERQMPGRLVGLSQDSSGRPGYRLALATREQHIRRERATSNICTAQALPAQMAACFAVYHGPQGLRKIADSIRGQAGRLAGQLTQAGLELQGWPDFDTVVVSVPEGADTAVSALAEIGIDVRRVDGSHVAIVINERSTDEDCAEIVGVLGRESGQGSRGQDLQPGLNQVEELERNSSFLTQAWFHRYRTETEMMRWLRRLADRDLALDRGMIPLGSCTMKLNAAVTMEPISWPGFADIHPLAPPETVAGYRELVANLERWLGELTGFDQVSIQPNAGSQGELAGLLAIRAYHRDRGQPDRDICLIPASAHGTNAASAAMAGFRVVAVKCDQSGGVDPVNLEQRISDADTRLGAIMITYPSTYGIFEDNVRRVCEMVHAAGGQVYLDGANLNAMLGYATPGDIGADVSHLNLHKTFAIPHGGGGPGVGPVAVKAHLAPYLPRDPGDGPESTAEGSTNSTRNGGPVSGAPWGNAGVLPITYAYLRLLGVEGLRAATREAVLAANYVAARLSPYYPILFRGNEGLVAHECIVDLRETVKETGVTAEDVAKRLIDYGFHAPTLSFPVSGTLMIEPTESESRTELDRFCDAMISIWGEIDDIASGRITLAESPLRRSPHPAEDLVGDWDRPYSRRTAVFPGVTADAAPGAPGAPGPGGIPAGDEHPAKYWPPVGRIDNAAGDRNLVCTCPPVPPVPPVE